jgi:hypothetical protein
MITTLRKITCDRSGCNRTAYARQGHGPQDLGETIEDLRDRIAARRWVSDGDVDACPDHALQLQRIADHARVLRASRPA